MAKEKLIATKKMMYKTRHLQAGDPFEANWVDALVFTKLRKTARPDYDAPVKETLAVPQQAPEPPREAPDPSREFEPDIDVLRAEAEAVGVHVDRRWGEARLRQEIASAAQRKPPETAPAPRPSPVMTTTSYYTPPPSGGDSVRASGSDTVSGNKPSDAGSSAAPVNVGSTAYPVYRRIE